MTTLDTVLELRVVGLMSSITLLFYILARIHFSFYGEETWILYRQVEPFGAIYSFSMLITLLTVLAFILYEIVQLWFPSIIIIFHL